MMLTPRTYPSLLSVGKTTYGGTFQGVRVGNFCVTQVTKMFYSSLYFSAVLAKGEMELEGKETSEKVQEDRKHGYPYRPVHFKHTRQDCYTLCLCRLGD